MSKFKEISEAFIGLRGQLARSIITIVPPDTVEDIVQESYVKLCQLSTTDEIKCPKAYFFRAVKNLAIDHVRRVDYRKSDTLEEEQSPAIEDTTFRDVVSHEQFGHFCDAVRRLPVQCRRVFVLKKVYNYSQKEIAQELGISEKTVEKHVALGLERCRDHMERYQPELENPTRSDSHRWGGKS